jgi:proline-rich tail region repeat protein
VKRLLAWLTAPAPPRPPRDDRIVEVAWLPLWQCQLVLHDLWEHDVPATMSEDHTSHLRLAAREPMARIFVMEPRRAAAEAVISRCIGGPPPTQDR